MKEIFYFRKAATAVAMLCFVAASGGRLLSQSTAGSGAAPSGLVVAQHVTNVDQPAREPSIVEHSNGTLFVSGYGRSQGTQQAPRLWKSMDHGATWSQVNVGSEADGAIANSDVSLAVARDGTLYFAAMEFDRKVMEGVHIVVGASKDAGASWHWTMVSKKRFDDRPWVAVAPDGAAHVIWNDGGGVYHTLSRDRGATWSVPQSIHPEGGSSHLAIGPNGEVAVRITPASASGHKFNEGVNLIAVSTDGGTTWQKRSVPGERDWAPQSATGTIPRWVEPIAWDSQGALYNLWTDIKGVWLAQSADRGASWKTWRVAEISDLSYYPYLTARGPGELAATWFSGAGERLRWHVARIQVEKDEAQPRVVESAAFETESWAAADAYDNAPLRDPAGEYLPVLFLSDGDIAVVSPIQNPATKQFGFSFWRFEAR